MNSSIQVLLEKYPEHPVYRDFLNDLLPRFPSGSTVLELGVNEGTDTFRMLSLLNDPRYFGFEPEVGTYNSVFDLLSKSGYNAELINAAISEKSGKVILHQSKLSDGSDPGCSSIKAPKNVLNKFSHILFETTVDVDALSLDDFVKAKKIDHISFIWSDIQGAEIDMIRGGQTILANTDYMLLEYCNEELYKEQGCLNDLLSALPGNWIVLKDYLSDVFIKRVS